MSNTHALLSCTGYAVSLLPLGDAECLTSACNRRSETLARLKRGVRRTMKRMRQLLLLLMLTAASAAFADPPKLVAAARHQTRTATTYDGSYTRVGYPMGDVPSNRGVCTDLVIRAYRVIGIDLQVLVHEDMRAHFDLYPRLWGLRQPDANIRPSSRSQPPEVPRARRSGDSRCRGCDGLLARRSGDLDASRKPSPYRHRV